MTCPSSWIEVRPQDGAQIPTRGSRARFGSTYTSERLSRQDRSLLLGGPSLLNEEMLIFMPNEVVFVEHVADSPCGDHATS